MFKRLIDDAKIGSSHQNIFHMEDKIGKAVFLNCERPAHPAKFALVLLS